VAQAYADDPGLVTSWLNCSGGHAVRRQVGGIDLLVEDTVPVEVAKVAHLTPQHEVSLRACLRDGGWSVRVLVNHR